MKVIDRCTSGAYSCPLAQRCDQAFEHILRRLRTIASGRHCDSPSFEKQIRNNFFASGTDEFPNSLLKSAHNDYSTALRQLSRPICPREYLRPLGVARFSTKFRGWNGPEKSQGSSHDRVSAVAS
jgi:hypothetical protein